MNQQSSPKIDITFFCLDTNTAEALRVAFFDLPNVDVKRANITTSTQECVATAGNSFGFMDGGVDTAVNYMFSPPDSISICEKVKHIIKTEWFGEQPVGTCLLLNVQHPYVKWLAHAPTMRVPEDVSTTLNAYIAFRAVLIATVKAGIKSLACPCFCTAAGQMPLYRASQQMRMAYDSVFCQQPPQRDWKWAHATHRHLKSL